MPGLLDMAEMFANKFEKDGHLKDEKNSHYFVMLVYKIHMAKFKFTKDLSIYKKAIDYLAEKKGIFGIELDYKKTVIEA